MAGVFVLLGNTFVQNRLSKNMNSLLEVKHYSGTHMCQVMSVMTNETTTVSYGQVSLFSVLFSGFPMASGILLFVGLSSEEVRLIRQNSTASFTSDIWRQKLQRLLDHQTKVSENLLTLGLVQRQWPNG